MSTNGAERYVATQSAALELLADYEDVPLLAVDTEFVRESTYYPKLCLVQTAAVGIVASDILSHHLMQLDSYAPGSAANVNKPRKRWKVQRPAAMPPTAARRNSSASSSARASLDFDPDVLRYLL